MLSMSTTMQKTRVVAPTVLPSLPMAKISISLDDDLYQRLRIAAGKKGVSAWLAETAAARLRREILRGVVDEIVEETGRPITEQEREEARRWLFSSSTPEA
jgi:predicted transcriptional regulator